MEIWFGTPFCPRPEEYARTVSALVERTKQALASGDIVEVHNAYVTYLAMALMSATGHRPVIDPFCYREWFDCESGTCLICDKVVSERHRYRLSWLAPQSCDALAAYDRHLRALSGRLAQRIDPHGWVADQIGRLLSGQAPAIPYLFYLGQTGTISLSPT